MSDVQRETGRARTRDGHVAPAKMPAPVFVLDRAENPHPRMLGEALLARQSRFDSTEAMAYWLGYRAAMVGATGCEIAEIEGWMDHHEGGTDVPLPHRRL